MKEKDIEKLAKALAEAGYEIKTLHQLTERGDMELCISPIEKDKD
jgi:hypothetical protein